MAEEATKKLLIILGSPRRKGNSATLAARAAAGAKAAGAIVETFYLHGMNIRPCSGCDACQGDPPKDCVIDDDMRLLYPKVRQADAVLIASPVYWFAVSAQTKLFIDRCYALNGPSGHALKGKRVGVVLTYGGRDPFSSGAVNALRMFHDAFTFIGAEIVDMVHGTAWQAGDVKANRPLLREARDLGKVLVG